MADESQQKHKDHDLIARLDERVKNLERQFKNFISQDRFKPVEMITYGLAGGVLLTVLGLLLGKLSVGG